MNFKIFALCLLGSLSMLLSFSGNRVVDSEGVTLEQIAGGALVEPGSGAVIYNGRLDTITNTGNDTIAIPATFLSPFQTSASIALRTLTGTRSAKLYIQEANNTIGSYTLLATSSPDWTTVDSVSLAATANYYKLNRLDTYGRRVRYIVDGQAGATQSLEYKVYFLAKKKVD